MACVMVLPGRAGSFATIVTCGVLKLLRVGGKFQRNVPNCNDVIWLARPLLSAVRCVRLLSEPMRSVRVSASGASTPLPRPSRSVLVSANLAVRLPADPRP